MGNVIRKKILIPLPIMEKQIETKTYHITQLKVSVIETRKVTSVGMTWRIGNLFSYGDVS